MKKVILVALVALFGLSLQAQDGGGQTDQGSWLIETNTNFSAAPNLSNTGFSLASVDGATFWSIGAEGGYFVADNLALKLGLGYQDNDGFSAFSYKVGAKYYVVDSIPFQVDYSGSSIQDAQENPSYLGLQGGYAVFLGDNVSIEPGLRYNLSLNDDFFESVFQFNIGFALHF